MPFPCLIMPLILTTIANHQPPHPAAFEAHSSSGLQVQQAAAAMQVYGPSWTHSPRMTLHAPPASFAAPLLPPNPHSPPLLYRHSRQCQHTQPCHLSFFQSARRADNNGRVHGPSWTHFLQNLASTPPPPPPTRPQPFTVYTHTYPLQCTHTPMLSIFLVAGAASSSNTTGCVDHSGQQAQQSCAHQARPAQSPCKPQPDSLQPHFQRR